MKTPRNLLIILSTGKFTDIIFNSSLSVFLNILLLKNIIIYMRDMY